ncbi:MAG TPA: tetratricopeptide repeat protein [Pyrinomonadaceae bacterium]|nr:tetratricopeptide repeat protein [Pyrinomonadaceae bacterium]
MRPQELLPTKFLLAMLLLILSAGFANAQTDRLPTRNPVASKAIRQGNALYAKAEYDAAIAVYRRVPPGAGQSYAQSLYNIGVCYYELSRTEDAMVWYRQAIAARQGQYPLALYALGVALEDQKRLPEAKEAYQQAITTSGDKHAAAHYRLGLLTAFAHNYEAAADLFKKAIALSRDQLPVSAASPDGQPGWGACHNNLGVVLALSGRLNEAKREFETALSQTHGTLPEVADNLKLCRAMLSSSAKAELASLKLTEANARTVVGDR